MVFQRQILDSYQILCVGIILSAILYGGCERTELPGNLVGRYRVIGMLKGNTCGIAALPATDPLLFEVEIRKQAGMGIWAIPEKPFLSGKLTQDGEFIFRIEESFFVPTSPKNPETMVLYDPEKAASVQECRIDQIEVIKGTIHQGTHESGRDAGNDQHPELRGEDIIDIVPSSGSECNAASSSSGGPFSSLPCQTIYTLEGELQDS